MHLLLVIVEHYLAHLLEQRSRVELLRKMHAHQRMLLLGEEDLMKPMQMLELFNSLECVLTDEFEYDASCKGVQPEGCAINTNLEMNV